MSRPSRIHDRRASSRRSPVDSATAVARPAGETRRFEHDEERLRRAGRAPPAGPAGPRSGRACPRRPAGRRAGPARAGPPSARPAAAPPMASPSSSVSGVMTTSHSSWTPRATASTGSKLRDRSSQATIEPWAWASAASRRTSVVRPLDPSPRIATLADRGRPPGPRIASSAAKPVWMTRSSWVGAGVGVGAWFGTGDEARGRRRCQGERPVRDPRSCGSPASLEARHGCRHVRGEGRHRTARLEHLFDGIKGSGPSRAGHRPGPWSIPLSHEIRLQRACRWVSS